MEKRGLLLLAAEFLLFDVLMLMNQLYTISWLGPFLIFLYFATWFTMHNLLRCGVRRKSIFLLVLGFSAVSILLQLSFMQLGRILVVSANWFGIFLYCLLDPNSRAQEKI
jgi:hypothetical protein